MKVYLASKFALKIKVNAIAESLKIDGIITTCEWWHDDIKNIPISDQEWYNHPSVISVTQRDYNGVDDADALILISDETKPLSFNGANVELGYAVAKGKHIYILGKVDRNALYSVATFCRDYQDLLQKLRKDML